MQSGNDLRGGSLMPLRHFKETQNAGAIGAPLGGNRANPGKHPRGNSGAIGGAIGPPPGGNWDPPISRSIVQVVVT